MIFEIDFEDFLKAKFILRRSCLTILKVLTEFKKTDRYILKTISFKWANERTLITCKKNILKSNNSPGNTLLFYQGIKCSKAFCVFFLIVSFKCSLSTAIIYFFIYNQQWDLSAFVSIKNVFFSIQVY